MKEETDTRSTWQNTLPYLERIANLENDTVNHLRVGDAGSAIITMRLLLAELERHIGRKKDGSKKEEYLQVLNELELLNKELLRQNSLKKSGVVVSKTDKQKLLSGCISAYEDIGYVMYKNDLVFKKDVDPMSIWAIG